MKLRRVAGPCVGGLLVGMLSAGVPMVACSSGGDDHHEDASADAALDAAPQDDGGSGAGRDANDDDSANGGQSPCIPTCASTQVCCVDQHAHYPRCVDGAQCLPPLQPPDGG